MSSNPGIRRARAVIAFVFFAIVAIVCFYSPSAALAADALASDSDIVTLQVIDTVVLAQDSLYWLSVYLTNPGEYISGVQMDLVASRADLAYLHDSAIVDTFIICPDPLNCDTSITTAVTARIDLNGSALAEWDYVDTRALSPYVLRMAALADLPGGNSPEPLLPGNEPKLLFRVLLDRGLDESVFDTLQDRSTTWSPDPVATNFSDPVGNTIGRRDTIICLDPPTCEALDTTTYDANILLSGSVTVAVDCAIGDTNGSGVITAADIIHLVNYIFKTGPPPACTGITGDVDCSGVINSADIIYLVNYTLKSGPAPCPD